MTTFSYLTKDQSDQKVVEIITFSLSKLLRTQQQVVFAIPGGRSVSGIFKLLKKAVIPWDNIHIFMIDERIAPLEDKESNFRLAKETFLDELVKNGKIRQENLHPFKVQEGVEKYQQELQKYGGKYDFILVSSGEDGHIGALFSNHHSIKDPSPFFITMDDSPKPPPKRMTMSALLVKKAQVAIILFYGEAKRTAYEAFQHQNVDVIHCPAKLVQKVPEYYVVMDLR
ncbi:6-phosphogluconolactonase [Candidatus Woesearchaeota archaeon]|nr:6-phosphogluconolactonase [Candidatus Woesearchaeota archaeon]